MMVSKLTLALDPETVKKAKEYARQKNLSLSKLVEFFFASLTSEKKEKSAVLLPITAELSGMVKAAKINDRKVLTDALIKKYL
jgi:hypothetical protein